MRASGVRRWAPGMLVMLLGMGVAIAQETNIRVQCPKLTGGTLLHPGNNNPHIKCQHLSGGDGFATMADTTPLYVFGFSNLASQGICSGGTNDGVDCTSNLQCEGGGFCDGVQPGQLMAQGTLGVNLPAPLIAIDEGDEFFLTLTNVGMVIRPDLADPHTVHFHGFPQASAVFDGNPENSISINMGASLTYYYLANDPGTYMYHCHVEATEHMQMGMLGNLYVRPAQNRLPDGTMLGAHVHHNPDGAQPVDDPLVGDKYAYNDGDGSTIYDVEYPILITSMDRVFHELHAEVQPLPFASMKDTYFMLNGRGYPDTVNPACLPQTHHPLGDSNGLTQCLPSLIEAAAGQRILLRIANLSVTDYATLGTTGIPMQVIARDARELRGEDGSHQYYTANSVTLGGGESADVILDTTGLAPGSTYLLYAKNLNYLSNDSQNFGGMMTEIRIAN